ncbi:hypothetical protein [Peptoniphilus harei]|nr:hypothetical protein [Peptoniphilus harei]
MLNYNYDELLLEFNFLQAFNIEISDIGFKETNILDIAFLIWIIIMRMQ